MKKFKNIYPEYYKNGEDFIAQHTSIDSTKEFFSGDDMENFIINLRKQSDDWHYRNKKVTYEINSLGYRSKEFDDIDWKNSIVVIGCSCTFGLGVSDDETLTHQLSLLTGKDVVNLGVIGASNQSILDTSLILKKKYGIPYSLIINWTSTSRFPYYGFDRIRHIGFWNRLEEDNIYSESKKYSKIFEMIYSEKSHEIITFRNILEATRNIWADKTIYLDSTFFDETGFYGELETFFISTQSARDLIHPGHLDYKNAAIDLYKLMKNKL